MSETNVTILDSTFKQGYAKNGGAIYISGRSSLFIINSSFSENIATKNGGAIAGDSMNSLKIFKSSRFENNKSLVSVGGTIFAIDPQDSIEILEDVVFYSELPTNFMNLQYVISLTIYNVTFEVSNQVKNISSNILSSIYIRESNMISI